MNVGRKSTIYEEHGCASCACEVFMPKIDGDDDGGNSQWLLHYTFFFRVPCTRGVRDTICTCPEQLEMPYFLSKNVENVQQN